MEGLQIQSLLAIFLPILVDKVAKGVTDDKKRFLIAGGVSILAGLLLNLNLFFPFEPEALLGNIAIVFTAAQASFKLYWQDSVKRRQLKLNPPKLP
jgi:hypothetical protein